MRLLFSAGSRADASATPAATAAAPALLGPPSLMLDPADVVVGAPLPALAERTFDSEREQAVSPVYFGTLRGEPVAIVAPPPGATATREGAQAWVRRIELLMVLHHSNVLPIIGTALLSLPSRRYEEEVAPPPAGETPLPQVCLVTKPWVATLDDLLAAAAGAAAQGAFDPLPPLTPAMKLSIAIDVARALAYLHGRRPAVTHGDVSPRSVAVDAAGRVMLIGFDHSVSADVGAATPGGGRCANDLFQFGRLLSALAAARQVEGPSSPPAAWTASGEALVRRLALLGAELQGSVHLDETPTTAVQLLMLLLRLSLQQQFPVGASV